MDKTIMYALAIGTWICIVGAYEYGRHKNKRHLGEIRPRPDRPPIYDKETIAKLWEEQERKREFFENLQIQQAENIKNLTLQLETANKLLVSILAKQDPFECRIKPVVSENVLNNLDVKELLEKIKKGVNE